MTHAIDDPNRLRSVTALSDIQPTRWTSSAAREGSTCGFSQSPTELTGSSTSSKPNPMFRTAEGPTGNGFQPEADSLKHNQAIPNIIMIGFRNEDYNEIDNFLKMRIDGYGDTSKNFNFHQYVSFYSNSIVVFMANSREEILHSIPKYWRTAGARAVIVITQAHNDDCRNFALEEYADDFMTLPISKRELLARIRSVWRGVNYSHKSYTNSPRYRFSEFTLDVSTHALYYLGRPPNVLGAYSFRLLNEFISHPYRTLTRRALLEASGDRCGANSERSIDVQVSRLRKHFGADGGDLIKVVRGQGYKFCANVTRC